MQLITIEKLGNRGVNLEDIGKIVLELQREYLPDLTLEECTSHVKHVLRKREVAHAVITGIALDELAEKKLLPEPLQTAGQAAKGPRSPAPGGHPVL